MKALVTLFIFLLSANTFASNDIFTYLSKTPATKLDVALIRLNNELDSLKDLISHKYSPEIAAKYLQAQAYSSTDKSIIVKVTIASASLDEMSRDNCNKQILVFSNFSELHARAALPQSSEKAILALQTIMTYQLTLIAKDNKDLSITCYFNLPEKNEP